MKGIRKKARQFYYYRNSGAPTPSFNLDTGFDSLNLQSNTADNFTTVTGAISQWTDLSPAARHATQATSGNRPVLNGLDPTFDGTNDALQLASTFESDVYSLYMVVKVTTPVSGTRVLIGGATANHYIALGSGFPKEIRIVNTGTTGGSTRSFRMYGEEYYAVLSIRKNAGIEVIKCNGRTLYTSSSNNSVIQNFGWIGRSASGAWGAGVFKAFCIDSSYFSDEEDAQVTNALFERYNLPEVSNAIVGFGDSITVGTGATTPITGGWLPRLATDLSRNRKNLGIGGSRLTALDANSGITRYQSQVIERPYSDTICLLYGTNDITGGVTGANYQSALESVLNGFLSAGYAANKIFVGTIPYRTGDADATLVADYNARITSVCSALGLSAPADVYNSMKTGGGDTLMNDALHPNDSGHQVIANAFAAVINP